MRICVNFHGLNRVTPTDPFLMSFVDEIINDVTGHECYYFIDEFSLYNQVPMAKEDQNKTTFICKFGSFAYKVMPFRLKNALVIFSQYVIKNFQEFLYKTMVVYSATRQFTQCPKTM